MMNSWDFLKVFPSMDESQKVIFFTGVILFLIILSNLLSPLINYLISRQTLKLSYVASTELFSRYLKRDYLFHTKNHSSSLIHKIQDELDRVISGIFSQILRLNSKVILSALLIINIFISGPKLSLMLFVLISFSYMLIYFFIKKNLNLQGETISKENGLQFQILSEAFRGIREVKLLHQEDNFLSRYKRSFLKLNQSILQNDLLNMIPKYLIESTLFLGIGFSVIFLLQDKGSLSLILPTLSLFLMTGYKLIPALSQLFSSISIIKTNLPAYRNLEHDLSFRLYELKGANHRGESLKICKSISIKNLNFTYPDANESVFKNLNLEFMAKKMTGLLGDSGRGKSTLIDLLTGLLKTDSGAIFLDDK